MAVSALGAWSALHYTMVGRTLPEEQDARLMVSGEVADLGGRDSR